MNSCIKDSFVDKLFKRCSKSKMICFKIIFRKSSFSLDRLHTHCKSCKKVYTKKDHEENHHSELIKQKKNISKNHDKSKKKFGSDIGKKPNKHFKKSTETYLSSNLGCKLRMRTS